MPHLLLRHRFHVVVTSGIYHWLLSSDVRVRTVGEIPRAVKAEGRFVGAEFAILAQAMSNLVARVCHSGSVPVAGLLLKLRTTRVSFAVAVHL